ncbi:MAG TPA: energy transducer TonB [Terriglobia bacterium]|nr:energy transducer TonB [Terriglobia bacterium]
MEPRNTDESAVFTTVTSVSDQPSWIASLIKQIRESYEAYKNPPVPVQVTAEPDPEAVGLLIEQPSALSSMFASIRGMIEDWRHPRTYDVEAVEVEEIWGRRRYKTQVFTFIGYAALGAVVLYLPRMVKAAAIGDETVIQITTLVPDKVTLPPPEPPKPPEVKQEQPKVATAATEGGKPSGRPKEVAPPPKPAPDFAGGGGGGGKKDLTPASKGEIPQFAQVQLVPPQLEAVNDNPLIAAPQTLVAQNAQPFRFDLPSPALVGLPTAPPDLPKSSGTGTGGGIGNGTGRGLGEGEGPGFGPGKNGGVGGGDTGVIANRIGGPGNEGCCGNGGPKTIGGAVKPPVPVYNPNPAYSEDARKNKITGQVLLEIIVKEDGTVDNASIKLLRKLGYGLDESAITTVRTWKFRPGTENGKPVPVRVTMEVTFRLL